MFGRMTLLSRASCVLVAVISASVAIACAPPTRDVKADDVPKLTSLKDLMDVQATIADPQFKKVGD